MATGRGESTKKGYRYEQVCDKDLREIDYGSVDEGDPIHLRGRKKRRSLRPKRQKSLEHESDTSSAMPSTTPSEDSATTDEQTTTEDDGIVHVAGCENLRDEHNELPEEPIDLPEEPIDLPVEPIHTKIFKCCLPCCSKNVTRNCRRCLLLGLSVTLVFLLLFIAFLAVLIAYPELTDKTHNKTTTITIPPLSVVKVDLDKYSISTLKEHKLNVSLIRNVNTEGYTGDVEVTICRHVTCNTKPLSLHIKEENKLLLRQWTKETNPTGNITIEEGYISWRWGNLTDPPIYNCTHTENQSSNSSNTDVASQIIGLKPSDQEDNDLILISFCGLTEASVNITECLPSPTTPYQPLQIDSKDDDDDNAVTLKFDDIFSEIVEHSKLYVKTIHLNSINDNYEGINLEIQPIPNKEVLIFAVVGMCFALLLLAITIMIIICLCCCCRGKECLHVKFEYYER